MSFETQFESARKGLVTEAVLEVAQREQRPPEFVRAGLAAGRIVIPANPHHTRLRPIGIGRGLTIKINANIGNSALAGGLDAELEKLRCAVRYGSDTVMDLSTGPGADLIRTGIIAESTVPIGTVPIYQAVDQVAEHADLTADQLLGVIESQALQGVDYMTVHAGLLAAHVPLACRRLAGIVSRGGAILAKWMSIHRRENPLYERFDDLLAICKAHDVTLSLGDGLRPGCLADASDEAQFAELRTLAELVRRARDAGVQAMVEGPGHVPLDQIERNMKVQEDWCDGAPFYVLGPVVIDCAPGYDHITSAIGGALAAYHGASMLCYVTPREHLGLPGLQDVRDGVVASRIAAHAADVALGRPHARDRDDALSRARVGFDWETQFNLALDPDRPRELRPETEAASEAIPSGSPRYCTMCGPKFCSMRISQELKQVS